MLHLKSAPPKTESPDSFFQQLPMIAHAPSPQLAEHSVLVVDPALDDLVELISTISNLGLQVTATATFEQARLLMSSHTPSILIAAIRLGIYNGLHLVLRGKAVRPDMAALVTAREHDSGLQADADATGATFIVKPISPPDLIAAIMQTVFRRDPTAPPIRAPFERRVRERRIRDDAAVSEERRMGNRRGLFSFEPGDSD